MTKAFTESKQLIEAFGLSRLTDFEEITPFSSSIGFSLQKPYPANSKFKPPTKKDGTPDTVVLVKVAYRPNSGTSDANKVPLFVSAGVFGRYISRHFDYNFQENDCPTEESIQESKKTPQPIDLESIDGFHFDHSTNTIQERNGKSVDGASVIKEMYNNHVSTIDTFRGRIFRWKIASVGKASLATQPVERFLKWALQICCGRTFGPSQDAFRGVLTPYLPEDMKLLVTESIDIFGYRGSKNVIGTFCAILLLAYTTLKSFYHIPQWLVVIGNNTFLGSAACILAIGALDHLLPQILFRLINRNVSIKLWLMQRKIRYK